MITRETAIQKVSEALLHIRKMDRAVRTKAFTEACDSASERDFLELEDIIKTMNAGNIRRWIKKVIIVTDLHDYKLPQLRIVAKRYNISYWNELDKTNLIEAIENERRRRVLTDTD